MSEKSKPVDEPVSEPIVEPAVEPVATPADPVAVAQRGLADAEASVAKLTADAEGLLAQFNTQAQVQPVDTAKLLELARARDDILGTETRPGSLARATASVVKARGKLADASWGIYTEQREQVVADFRTVEPERPASLPVPTVVIVPLDDTARASAMADAEAALAAAQWRVGLLVAGQFASGLLALGCDRLRIGWEKLGDQPQPVHSVKPVRAGELETGRKPATRKPATNGGTRSRASYTDDGASYTAREYAEAFEPERAAAISAKIADGASLSHTHLADSIMKRRTGEGHTVSKSV